MKPLNTGVYANVPNSFVSANPSCKIFKLKPSSTNTYECSTTCVNNQMMTLNTGSYVCPVSANLPFYDSQCATYIDTGSNTYECIACKTTYSLKVMSISNINYKRCLKNLFTDCTIYSSDGVCSKCLNGVSFNTYFNICPSQAFKLVSNCQAAVLGSTTVSCIACKTDYIVSPTSGCFTQIQYCETYSDSGKCKKCVFGYALMNNVCYKCYYIINKLINIHQPNKLFFLQIVEI